MSLPRPSEEEMAALDESLLLPNGRMRMMPASELLAHGRETLLVWCILRARYQLVTTELVMWLAVQIGRRRALEIGAGQGDLGYHLGIRQTDLGRQTEAFEAAGYHDNPVFHEQVPTVPPPDVERIDAETAVQKYEPAVVIGAWITERDHNPENVGHTTVAMSRLGTGVEEIRVVRSVETYIHVGNDIIHAAKRIYRLKHRHVRFDWLVSRAFDQTKNSIRVWERRR
jgi:hypothetical protein